MTSQSLPARAPTPPPTSAHSAAPRDSLSAPVAKNSAGDPEIQSGSANYHALLASAAEINSWSAGAAGAWTAARAAPPSSGCDFWFSRRLAEGPHSVCRVLVLFFPGRAR